jgi:peptidoglycan/xylan/chitin deacetylase (PgdA/CDA1 family)
MGKQKKKVLLAHKPHVILPATSCGHSAGSIGKCKTCGKSLCGQCALMYRSHLYCVSSCIPKELIDTYVKDLIPKKSKAPILWAVITLILVAVSLSSLGIREIYNLKNENDTLLQSRNNLIHALKENNRVPTELSPPPTTDPINFEYTQPQKAIPDQSPQIRERQPVYYHPVKNSDFSFDNGATILKAVCLTFDGASEANTALPILDTLTSRNVKATLFLTGHFLKRYPDIVRKFLAGGHEIGNHTQSHLHLTSYAQNSIQTTLPDITEEIIRSELQKNDELFYSITGQKMVPVWRAPYGEFNRTICEWARQAGFRHVGWRVGRSFRENLDSNDWIPDENTPGFKTPEEVLAKIINIAESNTALNGGIILMHLGTARKEQSMQVYTILGRLIDELRSRGFRILTVSEMIKESDDYLASLKAKTDIQGADN